MQNDLRPQKSDEALKSPEIGADHLVNGSKEDVVKRVKELTNGLGVDIVVETANHPSTVPLAISLAAARGRVVLFGLYPEATLSPAYLTEKRFDSDWRCGRDPGPVSQGHSLGGV